ncbi:Uncharacterised protein [Klebsiella pneumoniae]|nr:Uncharacterised protein [Klebsiella pneumoniae]
MNEDRPGFDIAVDQVVLMHLAQGTADADRHLDKAGDPGNRLTCPARQQFKAERRVDQRKTSAVLG